MRGWSGTFLGLAVLVAPLQPVLAAQKPRAIAHLAGLDGKPLGTADFRAVNRGVIIEFDLHNLPPGPHALHLHTSGNCSIMQQAHLGFCRISGPIS